MEHSSLSFSTAGKVLTAAERLKHAKAKGVCPGCGVTTHEGSNRGLKRKKLTNGLVFNGICIHCCPTQVPPEVLQAYQDEQKRRSDLQAQRRQKTSEELEHSNKLREEQQRKVHLPTSVRQRVLESWKLVQDDVDAMGMDFFLRVFSRHPKLKHLFHFGNASVKELTQSGLLKNHARGVMFTIGSFLSGLSDMETLVPRLRQLGRMHSLIGVQPDDFDKIYPSLIACIKHRVGPDRWTKETEEAWHACYDAIVSVMKDPSRHLHVEPLEGWGLWNFVVCCYLVLVTPLQLAGLVPRLWFCHLLCRTLDLVSLLTCLLDWTSEMLHRAVQLTPSHHPLSKYGTFLLSSKTWFEIKFLLNRIMRRLQFSRFSPWPRMDATILISFAFQAALQRTGQRHVWLGLWQCTGLLRLVAVARVIHFMHCTELIALKKTMIRLDDFHGVRLARVSLLLTYTMHLVACLHCMVVQLSLSLPDNNGDNPGSTSYAPVLGPILMAGTNVRSAYLNALYWTFVNSSGIGTYDSIPASDLELVFTLAVHLFGALFYAVAAGSIFGVLESRARSFGKIGAGVSSLKDFMQRCNIPVESQDKFLSSYLMHNLLSQHGELNSTDAPTARPLLPEAADSLPHHLNMELTLFSRAKAIRDRGIKTASIDFSFVLAESLLERLTLLPGDFLFQVGDKVTRRVIMVDRGVLEVFVDGVSKQCLYPGDVIGLGWLATLPMDSKDSLRHKSYLDYVSLESLAIANVRAMDYCRLVLGLSHSKEVTDLRRLYAQDMLRIQTSCETNANVDDDPIGQWGHVNVLRQSNYQRQATNVSLSSNGSSGML